MALNPDGSDPVGELIENGGLVGGMVTGWTLFVTFIDPDDGEHRYYTDTMETQTAITTLGHLEAGAAIEKARIVHLRFADDD